MKVRDSGMPDEALWDSLFDVDFHHDDPVTLLRTAARCLRPGGRLFASHWRHDPATPRGPSLSIRPRPQQILAWAKESGMLDLASEVLVLTPGHYGLVLVRADASCEGLDKRLIDESR